MHAVVHKIGYVLGTGTVPSIARKQS